MRKILGTLFLVMATCFYSWSQIQVYKGQVLDAKTEQPIAFVNVVYSEGAGTVTDIDGRFEIHTNVYVRDLRVSCLGYELEVISVKDLADDGKIRLSPLKYSLPAVDVLPSENPALKVMRQVVENRHRHNPDNYDPFSCIMYHKMTLDFEWPAELSQEEIKELKDSLGVNTEGYMFLFESVSEKKHLKKGVGKEKVISGRVSGLKDPLLASFPVMLQPFSFYDQYIKLLGFMYLNPASKAGLSSYQFILEATYVNTAGDSVFYISYRPKADKSFRGMTGAFHIDGQSMAINTVSATTAGTENGMRLFIRQKYQPTNNGLWFPKQLESSLEFGSLGATRRFPFPLVGTGKSYVTAINTNRQFDAKEFDNVVMEDIASSKHSASVDNFRYEPLTARDSITYHILDSIGRRNHLDALIKTQLSLLKGYLPMGYLQLDLSKLIDYNDFEGLKLGAGIYTSPELSENFSTGGYYTYGFGDKRSKYGFKFNLTPFKNKDNRFYFNYKDDVYATGTYEFMDASKSLSTERFKRFLIETMDLSEGWSTGVDFRFLKFFKAGMYYSQYDIAPQKAYRYMNDDAVAESFDLKETGVKFKWANKETFVSSPFGMISNGTNWPVIWVNASLGDGNSAEEKYSYRRFESRIHKQFNYTNSMYTTIRIEGGYLSGDYPSTLLYSALGGYKSFTILVPYTFGTMRLNEFGASEFAALYFTHGIPLALNNDNRIKPEIVLSTNVALGNAPNGVSTINKGYYESGLYLKNLFSNFIFQYGLSVHYRYGAYRLPDAADNWAFKLGLEFAF
ncbi:carboxypeptidase-like regulatory domain-containing protein [Carboxylicivirga sp. A043]|uniref:DUF5686 and carboxypeptidase regulatory-like domain-containing protein n=1 Tax=Carboxylicivirga litoralis TaxID=2816963 RepID=UPI0021CB2A4E|nr:DUF5686 and carboxypeptidase regulatory-like domain-containing protein [Carboxylicivirga sp. A043]MCU4155403.1 carboxypeptidase-like regulatory domain-containing protein [Carboxylicivirga sp. A043]